MRWLSQKVDEVVARHPEGDILIESGGSPSGTYHLGHMRELVICDALLLELRRRGRQARHVYFVDDFDVFRKIPANVPQEWEQHLGKPLCDVPSPDGQIGKSYADYFLQGLMDSCKLLGIEVEFVRSHPKYRSGWFVPAIELCLEHIPQIRQTLENISNRKLDPNWTPIQILEKGRLKNRKFVSLNKPGRTIDYLDAAGNNQTANYNKGEVKLDWRLDWPARWWLLNVQIEPFGREHASAGGSYDTGAQLMKDIFKTEPPIPVPYDSINMIGDTKKMSASKGTAISAMEGIEIMPAEVIRYFILRAPLNRLLYFDPVGGVVRLMDEFAELTAKTNRSAGEDLLIYISTRGKPPVVSRVPFSHLVASYQASLKDADKTLSVIGRTEYSQVAKDDADIIRNELRFIDNWLLKRAPDDVKFALSDEVDTSRFGEQEKLFFKNLADKVSQAPDDADGAWFHNTIYEIRADSGLEPTEMFSALYRLIINRESGPRAGWFLSILPRDWLNKRLRLGSGITTN
jgi:lysyl-tRNA synthetase, class I